MARRFLFLCAWLAIASTMASASADRTAAGRGRHAPPDPTPPRVENEWVARTIPARWGHQLLFDARRNRVVIVGGEHAGAIWGDAWAIELGTLEAERITESVATTADCGCFWDRIGPATAAVIDPRTDQLFVHGGMRRGVIDGPPGTWVGDQGGPLAADLSGGRGWKWLDTPFGIGVRLPSSRHGHVAVLDERRHRVVMFGGATFDAIYGSLGVSEPQRDVWAWSFDASRWDSLATSGLPPSETLGEGAAWDPVLDVVWYVARGAVWKLDLESAHWDSLPVGGALHAPDPVMSAQPQVPALPGPDSWVALDPTGRKLYRYVPSAGVQVLNVDAPGSWTSLPVGGEPATTYSPIAWDSRARRLLRFSGSPERPNLWFDIPIEGAVLWGLSVDHPERGWQAIYDARLPKLGYTAGVFDARRDRILAVSGYDPLSGFYELRHGHTQWTWIPVESPFVFQPTLSSLVLDEANDRLVMDVITQNFAMEIVSLTFSFDLRSQDGWKFIAETRWDLWKLAWDSKRQRVLRIGWFEEWQTRVQALAGPLGAEEWKGIPVAGTQQPRIRYSPLTANDEHGRVFLVGGYLGDSEDQENLWVLEADDSARWTRQRHDASFNDSDAPAMVWDPVRKRLMIHGAYGGCCGWRSDGLSMTDHGATSSFAFPATTAEWWTPRRHLGGLVYDNERDAFAIFGGVRPGMNSLGDAYEIAFAKPPRTIRVDARPNAGNDRVRPGTHQSLQIAALSDPGFDARTLDLATVYVAGVPIRRDGGGRPKFNVRDVDGDGREDIVLPFDAHDLPITESNSLVKLWGRTFDDARVEGLATVEVKTRVAGKNAEASPATSVDAPVFAVRTTGTAGSMRFACTVAGYPGARIEAFDIAGRRVASGFAPPQTGASVVSMAPEVPLARGVYLVRMTGPATLSRKVVALP